MRTALAAFGTAFTTPGGITSRWTNAARTAYYTPTVPEMPPRIGAGSLFWTPIKEALDATRYLAWYWTSATPSVRNIIDYNDPPPAPASYGELWNLAVAAGKTVSSASGNLRWYIELYVSELNYVANVVIYDTVTYSLPDTLAITGTRTATYVGVLVNASEDLFTTIIPMSVSSSLWASGDNPESVTGNSISYPVECAIDADMTVIDMSCDYITYPFDYESGGDGLIVYAEAEFGAPTLSASSPTTTCTFTELEVGTHLTYG